MAHKIDKYQSRNNETWIKIFVISDLCWKIKLMVFVTLFSRRPSARGAGWTVWLLPPASCRLCRVVIPAASAIQPVFHFLCPPHQPAPPSSCIISCAPPSQCPHTLSGRIGKVVASHATVARSRPAEVPLMYTMHVALRRYCPWGWGVRLVN